MAQSTWGIDISKTSVKCVRLERDGDSIVLTDIAIIKYPIAETYDEIAIEGRIKEALSEFKSDYKIKGEKIVCSLPTHSTFNRIVKLPPVASEKMGEILRFEAQSQIPFPISDVQWDYQLIQRAYEPEEEREVIIFAVKKDIVKEFTTTLEAIGIKVDIVQFAPVALYNFLVADQQVEGNCVVLDMGADNTDLIIVDESRFWIRNIPITGNDITRALQRSFSLSFSDAEKLKLQAPQHSQVTKIYSVIQPVYKDLIGELHRSIGWYRSTSRQARFDRLLFLGNATKALNFSRYVSQSLGLKATQLDRLNTIELDENVNEEVLIENIPAIGAALGLALQGLDQTANKVNMALPEYIEEKKEVRKRPLVVVALFIIYLVIGLVYYQNARRIERLQTIYNDTKKINQVQKEVQEDAKSILTDLENTKKGCDQIAFMGKPRGLVQAVIGKVNAILRNTNAREADAHDVRKIWVVGYNIEERPIAGPEERPVFGKDLELNVRLMCAVQRRQSEEDAYKMVEDNLCDPLEEAFKDQKVKVNIKIGQKTSKLVYPEKKGVGEEKIKYWLYEVFFTLPLRLD
jgi:type IV pilus assembly protein PilM